MQSSGCMSSEERDISVLRVEVHSDEKNVDVTLENILRTIHHEYHISHGQQCNSAYVKASLSNLTFHRVYTKLTATHSLRKWSAFKENQVHYLIYKTHQMDPVLTHNNPLSTLKTHVFKLNILLSCHLCLVLPCIWRYYMKRTIYSSGITAVKKSRWTPEGRKVRSTENPNLVAFISTEHRYRLLEELWHLHLQ